MTNTLSRAQRIARIVEALEKIHAAKSVRGGCALCGAIVPAHRLDCPSIVALSEARALRDELDAGAWKTIESAPKDGTQILASWGNLNLEVASYDRPHWRTFDGTYVNPPTHWMPLPSPPEDKGDE